MLKIEKTADETLSIVVGAEFDALLAKEMRDQIEDVAQSWDGDIDIDLAGTTFMDSSGIGAIVFLFKRMKPKNRSMRLVNVSGQPMQVIKTLGVHRVIPISNTAA